MATSHPELIFVRGPQSGERATLLTRLAVMGRQASCDIALREEFVSRQHVRFELSPDGWLMEVLSANGAKVNGKNYKAGKRLLLDTGDVVSVGMETEILFIAPGGDSEEALAKWRQDNQPQPPKAQPPAPAEPPAAPGGTLPPLTRVGPNGGGRMAATPTSKFEPEALTPAAKAAAEIQQKTKKYRKYAIYGGVYAVFIVGLILFVSHLHTQVATMEENPPLLTEKEIETALTADNLPRAQDQVAADNALKDATTLFDRRTSERDQGTLYQVVKCYRIYLAKTEYPGTWPRDTGSGDQARYEQASKELLTYVMEKYTNAYILERDKQWAKARRQFQTLMNVVPEKQRGDLTHDVFFNNLLKHAAFCGKYLPKK